MGKEKIIIVKKVISSRKKSDNDKVIVITKKVSITGTPKKQAKSSRICKMDGCDKIASYNIKGIKVRKFCKEHKSPIMVDVSSRQCIEEECIIQATYNFAGEKPNYCKKHAHDGMIDVKNKKCGEAGCTKQPTYNIKGETRAIRCKEHATKDMIDMKHKSCADDTCNERPYYNFNGKLKPLYCDKHKLKDMIFIGRKKCFETGCDIVPQFNFKGQTNGVYCATHAKPGMVDIRHKMCLDCDKRASFNVKGETVGIYCKDHSKSNMTIVTITKCQKCDKLPNYNFAGQKSGIRCNDHKEPDMIDVKHRTCVDCSSRVLYGIPGNIMTCCAQHKKSGMIRKPTTKCTTDNCKEIALYGSDKQQIHCEDHKIRGEINLIEKECTSCKLPCILNADDLCASCDPIKGNIIRLAKQNIVKNYLDQHDYKYISCDKVINNSECIKERPDFLFDCATHYLVLEVDEHQHNSNCECEHSRMVNISQALGMPTLFIRFNPDEYKINKVKHNTTTVKRLKDLGEFLKHYMKISNEQLKKYGFLSVLYLFYDEYDKNTVAPISILDFEKMDITKKPQKEPVKKELKKEPLIKKIVQKEPVKEIKKEKTKLINKG
jgi:hypothetical protein